MGLDITGIGALSEFATSVVNKIWPDASQKQKDEATLAILETTQEYNLQQGQIEVNKAEATNASIFVSGWRPFVGWVCGAALLYAAILDPIARFLAMVMLKYIGPFPVINTEITMQVLIGLLGLGGLRSWDKKNGVANK